MSSEPVIIVSQVSKRFQIYAKPEDRLKQMLPKSLRRGFGLSKSRYFTEFEAVKNVSLEVGRGETVGIIGRNGSGKSTLLQMICGTLRPSTGSIEVRGRIAALLELGAGFSPEFTGRQNVFLNCAILGLTQTETEARFESIERFADIGVFMDQPVKTYSSGMYIRLAFAVAINVDPDILVIDEALAVGDEAFQRKCFARIEQIRDAGATILFVSHGAQTIVQLCDRAILIDSGEKLMDGPPKLVVQQYQRLVHAGGETSSTIREELRASLGVQVSPLNRSAEEEELAGPASAKLLRLPAYSSAETFDPNLTPSNTMHYGDDPQTISDLRIESSNGERVNILDSGKAYSLRYEAVFASDVSGLIFGMQIKTVSGLVIAGANTSLPGSCQIKSVPLGASCAVAVEFSVQLVPGTYFIDVGIAVSGESLRFLHRIVDALMFKVVGESDLTEVGFVRTSPVFDVRVRDNRSERVGPLINPQVRSQNGKHV